MKATKIYLIKSIVQSATLNTISFTKKKQSSSIWPLSAYHRESNRSREWSHLRTISITLRLSIKKTLNSHTFLSLYLQRDMKYSLSTGIAASLLLTLSWAPDTIGVSAVPTGWEEEANVRKSAFSNVLHVLGKLSSKLISSEEHVSQSKRM